MKAKRTTTQEQLHNIMECRQSGLSVYQWCEKRGSRFTMETATSLFAFVLSAYFSYTFEMSQTGSHNLLFSPT